MGKLAPTRIVLTMAIVLGVLGTIGTPASAHHCGGGGNIDDGGGEASYLCHGNDPGRPPSPGLSQSDLWSAYCTMFGGFESGVSVEVNRWGAISEQQAINMNLPLTGTYYSYTIYCITADGVYTGGFDRVYSDAPPVDPEVLRDAAAARIDIDPPNIDSNPPFDERPTVVNFETWLWTTDAWEVKYESESAGFILVEVFARPDNIVWRFGDGGETVCFGPGTPWSEAAHAAGTECSHTFTSSTAGQPGSATAGTATLTWVFSWAINGADQGDFGVFEATTPFSIQVGEIQAVETGG